MFNLVLDSPWAGPLLWMALYISDYYSTIACARLYRGQDKIVFEGSYEITPIFQADVNALRRVSPLFYLILIVTTGYVFFLQRTAGPSTEFKDLYPAVLGALTLMEATIHMRHLRNWFLFKRVVPLIQGRVEYPRGAMLRMSALEIFTFSLLYSALFLVTESMFLLGGALACFVLSIKHYGLARRHDAALLKKSSA